MTTAKKIQNFQVNGSARSNEWILDHEKVLKEYFSDYMRERGFVPVIGAPVDLQIDGNSYVIRRSVVKVGQQARQYVGYSKDTQQLVALEPVAA